MSNSQPESSPTPSSSELAHVRSAWEQFIDSTSPWRSELFAAALRLTCNPFDAEDLVQDTLLRGFTAFANRYGRIFQLRAYLHRVMANLWIDAGRAGKLEPTAVAVDAEQADADTAELHKRVCEASWALFGAVPPMERACLVLQDICGFPQSEIAECLAVSTGSVKVAVHRARRRLLAGEPLAGVQRTRASRSLVENFADALLRHDVDTIRGLLIDGVEARVFPHGEGVDREENIADGWIAGCLYHHIEWRQRQRQPYPLILQVAEICGEPVILVQRDHGAGSALEEVWRFEEHDGRVARTRDYGFCPALVEHIAVEMDLPFRPVAYRLAAGVYEDAKTGSAD